jgi:hypothetical protein
MMYVAVRYFCDLKGILVRVSYLTELLQTVY